jgi:Phage integrase family
MRRHAPDGTLLPVTAYVFGTAVGEPIAKEQAGDLWRATCARAKVTDLHFHDLRREFACRLMESGASAHETRDALGHSNLTMTNQYLSTSGIGLARAFDRFERARGAGIEPDRTSLPLASLSRNRQVRERPRGRLTGSIRANPFAISGAGGGDRTHTALRPRDFKSRASASSATPASTLILRRHTRTTERAATGGTKPGANGSPAH